MQPYEQEYIAPYGGGTVTLSVTIDFSQAIASANMAEKTLRDYLSLARRSGFPENVDASIRKMLQLKTAAWGLYHSMMMLQAASGPIGLVSSLISLSVSGYVMVDLGTSLYDEMRGA